MKRRLLNLAPLVAAASIVGTVSPARSFAGHVATQDDDIYIVVDAEEGPQNPQEWTWTGFECESIDNKGCPANTPIALPDSGGNLYGCTPLSNPPPPLGNGCEGTCLICSGNRVATGNLCRRSKVIPPPACSGSGGTLFCGKKAQSSCATIGAGGVNPGPNGCGCVVPPRFPPNSTCNVIQCILYP